MSSLSKEEYVHSSILDDDDDESSDDELLKTSSGLSSSSRLGPKTTKKSATTTTTKSKTSNRVSLDSGQAPLIKADCLSSPSMGSPTGVREPVGIVEVESVENLEKQVRKQASYVNLIAVQNVSDPSLLRWYRQKKTSAPYPCCIRTNHDEGMGLVTFNKKNDTLIQFIGYRHAYTNKYCCVPQSTLIQYADERANEGEEPPQQWNAKLMHVFEQAIKSQKNVKDATGLRLLVEMRVIQLALEKVIAARRDAQASGGEKVVQSAEVVEQSDEDEEEKDAGNESLASSASASKTDTASSSVQRETAAVVGRGKDLLPKGKQRLRAGDVVQYYRLAMVASKENLRTATITMVYPGVSEDIALELNDGQCLPRDCQVRLVKRNLRGKLEENARSCMQPVEDYALDKSYNGNCKIATYSQAVSSAFSQNQANLVAEHEKFLANNSTKKAPPSGKGSDIEASDDSASTDEYVSLRDVLEIESQSEGTRKNDSKECKGDLYTHHDRPKDPLELDAATQACVLFSTGWARGSIMESKAMNRRQKKDAKRMKSPFLIQYSDGSKWLHDLHDPDMYLSKIKFDELVRGANERGSGVKDGMWCVVRLPSNEVVSAQSNDNNAARVASVKSENPESIVTLKNKKKDQTSVSTRKRRREGKGYISERKIKRDCKSSSARVREEDQVDNDKVSLRKALNDLYVYVDRPKDPLKLDLKTEVCILFSTGWHIGSVLESNDMSRHQKMNARRMKSPYLIKYEDKSKWLHDLHDPDMYLSEANFSRLAKSSDSESEISVKDGMWCVVRLPSDVKN